jgi:small subunit ribosomal protein S6
LKTATKNLYEAMFLVDSTLAGADWDGVLATIKNILAKAQVEIVSLEKWGERRLAYEINHKSKGTYIICYFRAEGPKIQDIERSVRLSEKIMRALILNTEDRPIEDLEKEPSAVQVEQKIDEQEYKLPQQEDTDDEPEQNETEQMDADEDAADSQEEETM